MMQTQCSSPSERSKHRYSECMCGQIGLHVDCRCRNCVARCGALCVQDIVVSCASIDRFCDQRTSKRVNHVAVPIGGEVIAISILGSGVYLRSVPSKDGSVGVICNAH